MCRILNKTFETAPAGRQPPEIFYNAVAIMRLPLNKGLTPDTVLCSIKQPLGL